MSWTQLIISQHPTQKQQTPHSSQVHMEHSPGLTTCWATKQALVNRWNYIKHLFWSQCYAIRNKLQEKNSKKYQYMVHKQYATQQPLSHWRNQRGNKKKFLETNENKSTTVQNLWDVAAAVIGGKIITLSPQEIRKIPSKNLTLYPNNKRKKSKV